MVHFYLTVQPSKSSKAFAEPLSRGPPYSVEIDHVGLVLCGNPWQIYQKEEKYYALTLNVSNVET